MPVTPESLSVPSWMVTDLPPLPLLHAQIRSAQTPSVTT
jgi:hypothetical protein